MPPLDQYDGQMDIITWKCPNLWTSQAQDCSAPESGCHCEPPAAGPGPGGGGQPMLCSRSRGPGTQNCSQALGLKFRAGSLLQQRQRGCSENIAADVMSGSAPLLDAGFWRWIISQNWNSFFFFKKSFWMHKIFRFRMPKTTIETQNSFNIYVIKSKIFFNRWTLGRCCIFQIIDFSKT